MFGRTESHVEEVAQPIYSTWQDGETPIDTTILASSGQIELHLSARGEDVTATVSGALSRTASNLMSQVEAV